MTHRTSLVIKFLPQRVSHETFVTPDVETSAPTNGMFPEDEIIRAFEIYLPRHGARSSLNKQ